MKAPDKIYIQTNAGEAFSSKWTTIPFRDFENTEYVRKDALLEQPDNEDIDKVAQELYEHLYELKRRNNVPTNLYDKQEIIDLWKAGIEYGRNHPKQEQPEVDLNDEIKKFIEEYGYERGEDKLLIAIVARHFFELGKTVIKEE